MVKQIFLLNPSKPCLNRNIKLHSIFHTNSKLLNPSTPNRHKENTTKYFDNLINERQETNSINGYCKTCGKKGILYDNSREFFPLSGSAAFVNYHHGHEQGIYLCNYCSIKLFFLPLGVVQLGGKIGLLHASGDKIRNYWEKSVIEENMDKLARKSSNSILHTKYSNPRNAMFYLSSDIIQEIKDENCSKLYNYIILQTMDLILIVIFILKKYLTIIKILLQLYEHENGIRERIIKKCL